MLSGHRILSAPVVTDAPGAPGGGHAATWPAAEPCEDIVGFVDLRSIVGSFLAELDMPRVKHMKMLARLGHLEAEGRRFAGQPLAALKVQSNDGRFVHESLTRRATVMHLIHHVLYPGGEEVRDGAPQFDPLAVAHRLAVFDSASRITAVVSQTDLCRYLHAHAAQLAGVLGRSVSETGWAARKLATITPQTPALEGALAAAASPPPCCARAR